MDFGTVRRAAITNVTHRYPQIILASALRLSAFQFNHRKALKARLRASVDAGGGWTNFTLGIRTEDETVGAGLSFDNGRVRTLPKLTFQPDVCLIYRDREALFEMLGSTPTGVLKGLMSSRFRTEGNFTYLALFNYYSSLLLSKTQHKQERSRQAREAETKRAYASAGRAPTSRARKSKITRRLAAPRVDPGVRFLEDPYLPDVSLDDYPRLRSFLDIHFTERPALCHERPAILTR